MIVRQIKTTNNTVLANRIKELGVRLVAREAGVDYSNLAKAVNGKLPINSQMELMLSSTVFVLQAEARPEPTHKVKLTAVVVSKTITQKNVGVYVNGNFVGNLLVKNIDHGGFMKAINWAHVEGPKD